MGEGETPSSAGQRATWAPHLPPPPMRSSAAAALLFPRQQPIKTLITVRVREAGDAQESHKEKKFFFGGRVGSHYPTAKINFVEGGKSEISCPVPLSSSLMGKKSPGHTPRHQRIYHRNAILYFLAGHVLPHAPYSRLSLTQKA